MRYFAVNISIQAILFNRVRDFRILIIISLGLLSGFRTSMRYLPGKNLFFIFILVGVIAKSSQVFFHSWLPNAIEGPTPVSSLLHSSTMVVAGVYLLLRMSDWYLDSYLVLVLGVLSMLIGGIFRMSQNDFKKVVAYSTTSQLGFIFVLIGMEINMVCLIYVCIHAFFKAILFLVSGAFIHRVNSIQDVRRMFFTPNINRFFMYLFILGSVVIIGFPFFSVFYMKDLMIDLTSVSFINLFLYVLLVSGLMTTCVYSVRVIRLLLNVFYVAGPKINRIESLEKCLYFFRLGLFSILSGLLFYYFFGPYNEVLVYLQSKTLPLMLIFLSCVVVRLLLIYSSYSYLNLRKYLMLYNPSVFKYVSGLYGLFSWSSLMLDYYIMEVFIPISLKSTFIKKYRLVAFTFITLLIVVVLFNLI